MMMRFRKTLFPLALILFTPPMAILMWYTNVALDGSLLKLWDVFEKDGILTTILNVWGPIFFGTPIAWKMIAIFGLTQLILMKTLRGKVVEGPITPQGNIPLYRANGVAAFITTVALFLLSTYAFNLFSPTIVYDNFGPLIAALNIFSLFFCLFLYFKGRLKPSSNDSGSTGHFIFDYFWGMELYPRIFGWDVKMFTNCRFGMMSWGIIVLSFAAKQHEVYGLSDAMVVSALLQLIFIAKFFLWEPGYLRSLDIMHDRAGYYICWGCLVWVPAIYPSPALYLVNHPQALGPFLSLLIFSLGFVSIAINYLADRQRQKVRLTAGKCTIWGKKPEIIIASYKTTQGGKKQSLLLTSGWWGLSRHFHYIPEVLSAFFWTLPALFAHILPYFYVMYLGCLLLDRAFRQERHCARKYGKHWEEYRERVPYKIIPFLF
jgi:7-dehydrocholesterol reductase